MRALARGLEVLDFLARREGSTFSDVCLATGLSKAVVHRILAELLSSGHVWRGLEEPLFYASASMAIVPKGAQTQAIKRAAVGPLVRLVSVVRWPSDLFARDGSQMILIDTTRSKSPFALRWSRIGRRVPILLSSVGRAVLAEMSEGDREQVFADLKRRGEWKRQLRRCSSSLEMIIQETNDNGYAAREPKFNVEELERTGIFSIGVPIKLDSEVVGALNVWWPTSADRTKRFAKKYIGPLRLAADSISANLAAAITDRIDAVSSHQAKGGRNLRPTRRDSKALEFVPYGHRTHVRDQLL
jgi:IclR family mhp operon transcriptional activator